MSDSVEVAIQRAAAGAAATGPATPIVIKEDRSIVVPTAMQQIAVQCDNEANVLHFVCPRNWADIDLAAATLYINVVKPDKSTVAFVCTNVVSSEDTVTFDWVVTAPVTDEVGKLSFLVCARDPSDPGNGYRWHSNLCDSLFIAPGIACVAPGDTPDPPHIPLYGTDMTLTKPGVPADAAAVGARLSSLSEKVTNLPQADWNQNDSTAADYVKNRPFYYGDPTVLMEECTIPFADANGMYSASFSINSEITEDIFKGFWKISWDGTAYKCTPVNFDGIRIVGNLYFIGGGSNTGEPFIIVIRDTEGSFIATPDTSASHTFSISHVPVVKVDESYLPSTIPFMEAGKIPEKYLPEKFPDVSAVFGGPLITSVLESTLANPYPNKTILNDLTVEAFNVLLNDLRHRTRYVMVDENVALVHINNSDGTILVSWSDSFVYSTVGKPLAGARLAVYEAKIHEDTNNPGTIISECAAVFLATKDIT